MDWLNYHHLLYFWTVAREGTVTAAAERLKLSRPTVTAQVRTLENALGQKLFRQVGRRLILTDFGEEVLAYADEIFTAGQKLRDLARGVEQGRRERLVIGLPDVMPKLIAFRLIQPAIELARSFHLVCREANLEELLAELTLHRIDIVLSDSPASAGLQFRAHSHKLGDSGTTIFAVPNLAAKHRKGFPESLHEAPMLLPAQKTNVRRNINLWMEKTGIHAHIVAEFDDSALLKVFGQSGAGLFPAPTAIEKEVKRQYDVQVVGRLDEVREEFHAISLERRLKHPAVLAITEAARKNLFSSKR